MNYNFQDFLPYSIPQMYCHPLYGWEGNSVDGVANCYRLDSWIWTPVGGKRFSISRTSLEEPRGRMSRVYSGKWPTFLGEQQSGHGADHPSQSSADIKNQ